MWRGGNLQETRDIVAADRGENGGSYQLGGENKIMRQVMKEISALLGRPAPKEISLRVLRIVAVLGDIAGRFTGKQPPITPCAPGLL